MGLLAHLAESFIREREPQPSIEKSVMRLIPMTIVLSVRCVVAILPMKLQIFGCAMREIKVCLGEQIEWKREKVFTTQS
jgi:hypothetical protein